VSERLVGCASPRTDPVCPLCRDELGQEERWSCEGCQTGYHAGCAWELGGCSTLGCARRGMKPPPLRRRRTPAEIEATRQRVNAVRRDRGELPLNAGLEERLNIPAEEASKAGRGSRWWGKWSDGQAALAIFVSMVSLVVLMARIPGWIHEGQLDLPMVVILGAIGVVVLAIVTSPLRRKR
jgi:hypothetical protein